MEIHLLYLRLKTERKPLSLPYAKFKNPLLKTLKQSFLKAVATVVGRIQQWLKACIKGKNQELDCNEEIMFYAEKPLPGLVNPNSISQTSMSLK